MYVKNQHTLLQFASSNGTGDDSWSKSIKVAAEFALLYAKSINDKANEDSRFAFALEGSGIVGDDNIILDYPKWEELVMPIRQGGYLGWDPEKDLFGYVSTPTVDGFGKVVSRETSFKTVSKTVQFHDEYGRPMAVVTLSGVTPRKYVCIDWRPLSLILYGVDNDGTDIDRPIFCTNYGLILVSPI